MKDAQKIWNCWYTIEIIVLYKHLAKLWRATWSQKCKASVASNFSSPGYKKILFLSLQPYSWEDFFWQTKYYVLRCTKSKNEDRAINWLVLLVNCKAWHGFILFSKCRSWAVWKFGKLQSQSLKRTTDLFIKWWGNRIGHSFWINTSGFLSSTLSSCNFHLVANYFKTLKYYFITFFSWLFGFISCFNCSKQSIQHIHNKSEYSPYS